MKLSLFLSCLIDQIIYPETFEKRVLILNDFSSKPDKPDQKPPARPIKRDGNIRRLADMKDDDDENNTWNGNSTQQM
ncbi:hypothetical protein HUJ04_013497 [Dendroctonus ponderosae]|nr:hypothetical protein HUJ04_013497 [Dendroctonus ponderosae]